MIASERIDSRALLFSLALGSVASLLALTSIILLLYAGFMVVAVFYDLVDTLARAEAAGVAVTDQSFLQLVWTSVVAIGRNGWQGIVSARFAYVAFAVLGCFAAAGWFFGGYTSRTRRWWFSFGLMAAVVVLTGVAWTVLQRDQILLWIAESPELFRWRHVLQRSLLTDVSVIFIFSLLVTIPVWMSWRWWFERIALRKKEIHPVTKALPSALAEHKAWQRNVQPSAEPAAQVEAVHADPYLRLLLSRSFVVPAITVFLLLAIVVGLVNIRYKNSTLRLVHEAFVLTSENPVHEAFLSIADDARKIRIVNINGQGSISIALASADEDATVVDTVEDWAFERRARQEYYYQEISLDRTSAGEYRLSFRQQQGWGWYEFMLSQGSTQSSSALSLLLGIALASAVLLGGLLLLSAVLTVRRSHWA